jgi:hypothetical protein
LTYQPKNQQNSTRPTVDVQVQPGQVREKKMFEGMVQTNGLQVVVEQHELRCGKARLALDSELVGPMGDL